MPAPPAPQGGHLWHSVEQDVQRPQPAWAGQGGGHLHQGAQGDEVRAGEGSWSILSPQVCAVHGPPLHAGQEEGAASPVAGHGQPAGSEDDLEHCCLGAGASSQRPQLARWPESWPDSHPASWPDDRLASWPAGLSHGEGEAGLGPLLETVRGAAGHLLIMLWPVAR